MSKKINPKNVMAQLHYRATGNPSNTLPSSAISNCFPGLEYDFKNFWRRAFVGILLQEWDNYVVEVEDEQYSGLKHRRLLKLGNQALVATASGPVIPGGPPGSLPSETSPAVISLEWSNALSFILQRQGQIVEAYFTMDKPAAPQAIPDDPTKMLRVDLTVRQLFEKDSVAPAKGLLEPGEMTQGLCSPWQHDYRECSCYYWPASRPDYVNVVPTADGISKGDNWLSKQRQTGEYVLDDRSDSRLVSYDDLFTEWEKMLHFQIKGTDSEES